MSNARKAAAPQALANFQATQEARLSLATAIVAAFNGEQVNIDAHKASLAGSQAGQLALIVEALKGAKPVTAQEWADDMAEQVMADLIASGRYAVDNKGVAMGARPVVSNLKPIVLALTHGFVIPIDASTVAKAAKVARDFCVSRNMLEPSKRGAPKKDTQSAAPVQGVTGKAGALPDELTPLDVVRVACSDLADVMQLGEADSASFTQFMVPLVTTTEGQAKLFAFLKDAGAPSPGRKSVF